MNEDGSKKNCNEASGFYSMNLTSLPDMSEMPSQIVDDHSPITSGLLFGGANGPNMGSAQLVESETKELDSAPLQKMHLKTTNAQRGPPGLELDDILDTDADNLDNHANNLDDGLNNANPLDKFTDDGLLNLNNNNLDKANNNALMNLQNDLDAFLDGD